MTYRHEGTLRPATVEHTSAGYPDVLGLRPALGRWFTAAEDVQGAAIVAVLGYDTWRRTFGGDPSVVGRTIQMEGVPVTIVGVGPAGYRGTVDMGIVTDFWLPIGALPALGAPPRVLERRPEEAAFMVKARLRDGVTVEQAQAAMTILAARLATEYPDAPGTGIRVFRSSDVRVHPQMDGLLNATAGLLLTVVGLVLAIACSNLATLLLVRGTARATEVSIRLALGATRLQLVRQLLVENLLLSVAGGVAGCVLAWWAIRLLGTIELPVFVDFDLDLRVLLFAMTLALVTGAAFGLAPALKSTRVNLVPTLRGDDEIRSSGRRWLTLKNALIVFQVAVSALLLGATGIVLQMLDAARRAPAGFAIDGIAMVETDPRYVEHSGTELRTLFEEVRQHVAVLPGVDTAVLTRGLPMQTVGTRVIVEGTETAARPDDAARPAVAIWAGPGFFDALRIPILSGRPLDDHDRAGTRRVAVISETMARQYFDAGNPAAALGRRFRIDEEAGDHTWYEVVGVARDAGTAGRMGDLVDPTPQVFYRSYEQAGLPPTTVLARTSHDAAALVGMMQRELRAADASLPVVNATTMARHLEASLTAPRTMATFLGALGTLGLGLAGIGLYAVVAFAVSRRSREIGIRVALGARSAQVVWTVVRDVGLLVAVGTAIGMVLTLATIYGFRSVTVTTPGIALYRPTADPRVVLPLVIFMFTVSAAAAWLPARRAARMDPLVALRRD